MITDISLDTYLPFLDTDFYMLVQNNNYNSIMENIKARQALEENSLIDIETKKHHLIIWNAFLAKGLLQSAVNNDSIVILYQNIYKNILSCKSIKSLHALELSIFDSYIHKSLNGQENKSNFLINNMIKYIHLHIEDNFSLNQMAKDFNNSPSYLSSLFKDVMNISITNYVHKMKIERAKLLLKTSTKPILEISNLLYYCDTSHFSKTFKKFTGVSPIQYRNQI
ncbi:AraC family transcriptional regulator [uncultured Clostridium sp.]|uniref:helix-turn-helix domain-containing protein n=1 Tax=uncultured Clostridium sp. TaxID=59620 RepID=UPI002628AE58|nr:AraC family transcriptional regulator [uncultured Clostridium sp.]